MPVLLADIKVISFDIKRISYNREKVKRFRENYIFLASTAIIVYNGLIGVLYYFIKRG